MVGGQERLGEGAPVLPKVVERRPPRAGGLSRLRRSQLPTRLAASLTLLGLAAGLPLGAPLVAQTTRAERTAFRETSSHADVLAFLDSLQRRGAGIRIGTLALASRDGGCPT